MELKVVCKFCKGVKALYGGGPCPFCEGKGNETVITPGVDYYHSVDISDQVVYEEFENLTEEQSLYLSIVLGAGIVNMKAESMERNNLRAIFPVGTVTNANISALIGESL